MDSPVETLFERGAVTGDNAFQKRCCATFSAQDGRKGSKEEFNSDSFSDTEVEDEWTVISNQNSTENQSRKEKNFACDLQRTMTSNEEQDPQAQVLIKGALAGMP